MRPTLRAVAVASLLAAGSLTAAVTSTLPARADTLICDQFGSTTIQSRYVVQNNRWGTSATQCINVTATGFQITQADGATATNGAPKSYPSVYNGCHYTNCSPGTNLPMRISSISSATSSIGYTFVSNAAYDAAYDIWLDPTAKTDGVNQTEIMIWFNRVGSIQPVGSQTATATVGGRSWAIWTGNNGANNVISFVAPTAIPSMSFNVMDFVNQAISRGLATNAWFLTSIQAGFEPWQAGVGLAVNSFSATVNGGGGGGGADTQAPTAPSSLAAAGVTATSANLSWSGSSDNVGVTGYDVLRRTGSSGTFTQAGTAAGTSFQATGLSASTQYQFQVTAHDAAGNTSTPSNTVTITTGAGGGGGVAGCRVTYTPNSWADGFTTDITVANTGAAAVDGWSLAFTLPGGQTITSMWNATITPTSGAVTARNVGFNAAIAPNGSQGFGFQGSYSGTFTRPTAFSLNGAACTVA
jgi:chitodextrinase